MSNKSTFTLCLILCLSAWLTACTQEQQNKISRGIQNWTGTNGVMEIYAGDKLVRRFIQVDKVSTALGTDDSKPRAYRYGYGVLDENLNMVVDPGEKKRSTSKSVTIPIPFSLKTRVESCGPGVQIRPKPPRMAPTPINHNR